VFVDDDSALSRALLAALDPASFTITRASVSTRTHPGLGALCDAADAVIVVAAGSDNAVADQVGSTLDDLIGTLCGSAKRLLYVSDATVIGDTGDSFGNEDNPRSSKAAHAWQVAAEERLARAMSTGIHAIIVRPTLVYGRHAGALIERLREHAERTGESVYVGDGSARTSTVHIDDLATLVRLALLHAPAGAIYMAASDQVLTWREVAAALTTSTAAPCRTCSLTAEEAEQLRLDTATMSMNCVIRDNSPHRRLGWTPQGPPLGD
jgi:nucleoside-diphosphate-sugar epimerase